MPWQASGSYWIYLLNIKSQTIVALLDILHLNNSLCYIMCQLAHKPWDFFFFFSFLIKLESNEIRIIDDAILRHNIDNIQAACGTMWYWHTTGKDRKFWNRKITSKISMELLLIILYNLCYYIIVVGNIFLQIHWNSSPCVIIVSGIDF